MTMSVHNGVEFQRHLEAAGMLSSETARRIRIACRELHWSAANLAKASGYSKTWVYRWTIDERPVPPGVVEWLEKLVALHRANPPPRRQR